MAVSAVMTAVSAAGLVLGTALPTLQLSLYAALSAFPAVLAAEGAALYGILSATAATILGFVLAPDKLAVLTYALFFGWYGPVYVALACRMGRWAALAVKAALFNAALAAGLVGFRLLAVDIGYPWWMFALAGQPLFLLYDRVLGLFLGFYERKLRRYIMGGSR
ncbi:MAG: hypothetical protein GX549_01505 [Clostridiales bacterium]|nr:hypothetical protein [Clostridiales bacterium]